MENHIRKKRTPGRPCHGSYLLEVVATNQHQGKHILLSSPRDAVMLGLHPGTLATINNLQKPVWHGLYIQRVPITNGKIPGQQEVIDYFLRHPEMFNPRHRPVIGEILTGPFAGEHIALFTIKEIGEYFTTSTVRTCSQFQHTHAGIGWREAVDFADAERYYYRPEQWVLLNVFRRRYTLPRKYVTPAEQETFCEQLREITHGLHQWYQEYGNLAMLTLDHYTQLAGWHQQLVQTMRCQGHYARVKDILMMLKNILVKGEAIKPLLFIDHCKILERLANETRCV